MVRMRCFCAYTLVAATVLQVLAAAKELRVPADFGDIQTALAASNDDDEIVVSRGEYLTQDPLRYRGKRITIRSVDGAANTVIRMTEPRSSVLGSVVVFIDGEGANAVLEGFTITGGRGSRFGDEAFMLTGGGGVFCGAQASPTVRDCRITGNSAASGAGILVIGDSSPRFLNCQIVQNSASEFGGGIAAFNARTPEVAGGTIGANEVGPGEYGMGGGVYSYMSAPELRNCDISGNWSRGDLASGGGLRFEDSSGAIADCTITENYCQSGVYGNGGGLCVVGTSTLDVGNCEITTNVGGIGGGIDVFLGASPSVHHCLIAGNSAYLAYGGGGIRCWRSSPAIACCRIMNNDAAWGGGVQCFEAAPEISRSLIVANAADFGGGGVQCDQESRALIINCTIAHNLTRSPEVGQAGGISCMWSTPAVTNSIIWGNLPASPLCGVVRVCVTDQDPTFVEKGEFDYSRWRSFSVGTEVVSAPDFVNATGNYQLRADSPAIDSADPLLAPASDLAGNGICAEPDVGAYEFQQPACVAASFRRGDVNVDGSRNIADAVSVLSYLFARGVRPTCLDAADVNDNGTIDIADAIALLQHLFGGVGALPAPFLECGTDGTQDTLDCTTFASCE